jgi:micrococcal nuclease
MHLINNSIEYLTAAAIGIILALTFGWGLSVANQNAPVSPPLVLAPPIITAMQQQLIKPRIPVDVLRVIDGDTVEVRAHIWLGQHITTKVRIRSIDAPELQSRCARERSLAEISRNHLLSIIGNGRAYLTELGHDKFGSRVLANLLTVEGQDIATLMLNLGHARPYVGGRRQAWC